MDGVSQISGPVLGASVCLWRDGEILLVKRAKAPARNLWSLPGGHVRFGEALEDAARRELREETAVEAKALHLIDFIEILPDAATARGHYVLAVFSGLWADNEPRAGDDAGDVRWFAPKQVEVLDRTAGLDAIIARAVRFQSAS